MKGKVNGDNMHRKIIILVTLLFLTMFPLQVRAENAPFLNEDVYYSCGTSSEKLINKIPSIIPKITESAYNAVMVIVPAIIIFLGIFDLVRGIISQKEDEIKKGRDSLIKRLVTGFMVFLVVMLVKFFVSIIAPGSSSAVMGCVDCFLNDSACYKEVI